MLVVSPHQVKGTLTFSPGSPSRRRVALGQEGWLASQGPAADMMELEWDEELALGAQLWANQCYFEHDNARRVAIWKLSVRKDIGRKLSFLLLFTRTCRFVVGQNLYTSISTKMGDLSADWNKALTAWYREVKYFSQSGESIHYYVPNDATGHFTQLVWARTRKVGCGFSTYIR